MCPVMFYKDKYIKSVSWQFLFVQNSSSDTATALSNTYLIWEIFNPKVTTL